MQIIVAHPSGPWQDRRSRSHVTSPTSARPLAAGAEVSRRSWFSTATSCSRPDPLRQRLCPLITPRPRLKDSRGRVKTRSSRFLKQNAMSPDRARRQAPLAATAAGRTSGLEAQIAFDPPLDVSLRHGRASATAFGVGSGYLSNVPDNVTDARLLSTSSVSAFSRSRDQHRSDLPVRRTAHASPAYSSRSCVASIRPRRSGRSARRVDEVGRGRPGAGPVRGRWAALAGGRGKEEAPRRAKHGQGGELGSSAFTKVYSRHRSLERIHHVCPIGPSKKASDEDGHASADERAAAV